MFATATFCRCTSQMCACIHAPPSVNKIVREPNRCSRSRSFSETRIVFDHSAVDTALDYGVSL